MWVLIDMSSILWLYCAVIMFFLLLQSQEDHTELGHHSESHSIEPVLKGLSVLGGIYVLFLIENLLGLLRERRPKVTVHAPTAL